ncbi:MAG: peptide deformylase, partial [Glaciihabitans sp.]|nr:peptide deformylase [Glaciihabitans sp.]
DTESEGCLSIPGERFPLRRAEHAILRGVDLDQKPFEIEADGWLARIFQHEFDHLNGVLYADRLEYDHSKILAKVLRKKGWNTPDQSWTPGVDHLED